jgi:hypothetical protein
MSINLSEEKSLSLTNATRELEQLLEIFKKNGTPNIRTQIRKKREQIANLQLANLQTQSADLQSANIRPENINIINDNINNTSDIMFSSGKIGSFGYTSKPKSTTESMENVIESVNTDQPELLEQDRFQNATGDSAIDEAAILAGKLLPESTELLDSFRNRPQTQNETNNEIITDVPNLDNTVLPITESVEIQLQRRPSSNTLQELLHVEETEFIDIVRIQNEADSGIGHVPIILAPELSELPDTLQNSPIIQLQNVATDSTLINTQIDDQPQLEKEAQELQEKEQQRLKQEQEAQELQEKERLQLKQEQEAQELQEKEQLRLKQEQEEQEALELQEKERLRLEQEARELQEKERARLEQEQQEREARELLEKEQLRLIQAQQEQEARELQEKERLRLEQEARDTEKRLELERIQREYEQSEKIRLEKEQKQIEQELRERETLRYQQLEQERLQREYDLQQERLQKEENDKAYMLQQERLQTEREIEQLINQERDNARKEAENVSFLRIQELERRKNDEIDSVRRSRDETERARRQLEDECRRITEKAEYERRAREEERRRDSDEKKRQKDIEQRQMLEEMKEEELLWKKFKSYEEQITVLRNRCEELQQERGRVIEDRSSWLVEKNSIIENYEKLKSDLVRANDTLRIQTNENSKLSRNYTMEKAELQIKIDQLTTSMNTSMLEARRMEEKIILRENNLKEAKLKLQRENVLLIRARADEINKMTSVARESIVAEETVATEKLQQATRDWDIERGKLQQEHDKTKDECKSLMVKIYDLRENIKVLETSLGVAEMQVQELESRLHDYETMNIDDTSRDKLLIAEEMRLKAVAELEESKRKMAEVMARERRLDARENLLNAKIADRNIITTSQSLIISNPVISVDDTSGTATSGTATSGTATSSASNTSDTSNTTVIVLGDLPVPEQTKRLMAELDVKRRSEARLAQQLTRERVSNKSLLDTANDKIRELENATLSEKERANKEIRIKQEEYERKMQVIDKSISEQAKLLLDKKTDELKVVAGKEANELRYMYRCIDDMVSHMEMVRDKITDVKNMANDGRSTKPKELSAKISLIKSKIETDIMPTFDNWDKIKRTINVIRR